MRYLQDKFVIQTTDAADNTALSGWSDVPLKRGKRHDYFTSCLPWPQKGDAVTLPLGTSADIHTDAAVGAAPEIYSTAATDFRRLTGPSPVPNWINVDSVFGS